MRGTATGLETAVEAFNNWTDVFAVWNESKLYRDASVVKVYRKDAFFGQYDQIDTGKLQELIDFIKREEGY